jgi:hypothetical protein
LISLKKKIIPYDVGVANEDFKGILFLTGLCSVEIFSKSSFNPGAISVKLLKVNSTIT